MTDEYTYKTYGSTQFYIPAGMYSIEELELMLAALKATKDQTEKHLKKVLKPLKENT